MSTREQHRGGNVSMRAAAWTPTTSAGIAGRLNGKGRCDLRAHSYRTGAGQSEPRENASYVSIVKSTALIGGSSVVNIGFGILRNKAMALMLGPGGVGLMGVYSSVADLAQSVAGMGVQSSGVRQIAEAVGTGDGDAIARTAAVLRQTSVALGILGASVLILFSRQLSQLTFGSDDQIPAMVLLSLTVLLKIVSAGQGALIQGMRRIADLARMTVLGAVFGTAITIPMVYFFRERGVVPSLVGIASVSIVTSWWYSRKIRVPKVSLRLSDVGTETASLLKLGVAFMVSGALTMGAAYVIRIIVLRTAGFDAAGLYQAAWALGGLYVGFILQAMGADFYPRLTAVARDNAACNRLVNEQAQISVLLAGPGVVATLTLAPLVIAFFYSAEFTPAVSLLRWICLGMMLRVVAWPMGFIVVAKGAQQMLMATEVAATVVHVGLAWLLVAPFGVNGAGIAFFGLYVWHSLLIYAVVRKMSGFRWSRTSCTLGLVFLPLTGAVFGGFYLWPFWLATGIGLGATVVSGVYSARVLLRLLPRESIPGVIRPWLLRLRLAAA